MSARPLLLGAAACILAIVIANAGLSGWLMFSRVPAPGGPDVVSVWRQGALVRRQLAQAGVDPRSAFAADLAVEGTSVVVEHVVYEGRALTLGRRLFGASFLAGRDGVRATLDGRDAYLTPQDLTYAGLYRGAEPGKWVGLVAGIDSDRVIDRLARELGSSADRVWKEARFRRFTVTRKITPEPAADNDPTIVTRLTRVATPARLSLVLDDAARVVADSVRVDGQFADLVAAGAQSGYDWRAHASATAFLAEAGSYLQSHALKAAARRAAWLMQRTLSVKCGPNTCIAVNGQGDLALSVTALLAYSELARERAGVPFIAPANDLAFFVRGQQASDGGFYASYDPARQRPYGDRRSSADAAAVVALGRAHRVTKRREDLVAAESGLEYLISRPVSIGLPDYLDADHRICDAVDDLWERSPTPAALEFCLAWSDWSGWRQADARGPIAEHVGGFRSGAGSMPDIVATANRAEGMTATAGAALRAGYSPDSVKAIDLRVARAFEFLMRQQLPGPNAHLVRDPQATEGGFTASPVDTTMRSDATAAVGTAVIRLLRVLEIRGLPSPAKAKRDANKIAIPKD